MNVTPVKKITLFTLWGDATLHLSQCYYGLHAQKTEEEEGEEECEAVFEAIISKLIICIQSKKNWGSSEKVQNAQRAAGGVFENTLMTRLDIISHSSIIFKYYEYITIINKDILTLLSECGCPERWKNDGIINKVQIQLNEFCSQTTRLPSNLLKSQVLLICVSVRCKKKKKKTGRIYVTFQDRRHRNQNLWPQIIKIKLNTNID